MKASFGREFGRELLKNKYWLLIAVGFFTYSVVDYAKMHDSSAVALMVIWGFMLGHYLTEAVNNVVINTYQELVDTMEHALHTAYKEVKGLGDAPKGK